MGKDQNQYQPGRNSFINPYNFVPVKKEPMRREMNEQMGQAKHTGYLQCRMITKTPLAIPDTAAQKGKNGCYPFMSIYEKNGDRKKFIPGSAIRGVIRSTYEAVTDSCMVTCGDEMLTARTGSKDAFQPGMLQREGDKWHLYKARRAAFVIGDDNHKIFTKKTYIKTFCNKENLHKSKNTIKVEQKKYSWGDHVWIREGSGYDKERKGRVFTVWESTVEEITADEDKAKGGGWIEGYVYIGEPIGNKHAESVFIKLPDPCLVKEADVTPEFERLKAAIKCYRDEGINRNLPDKEGKRKLDGKEHHGYPGFEAACEKGTVPIWYKHNPDTGQLYLSPAAIGRKAYENTLADIAGAPCKDRRSLCEACALFGMIGHGKNENGEQNEGYGSKVRFTDAKCITDSGFVRNDAGETEIVLKELGSPRPSYFPFYTKDGKEYDDYGIEIRGRKFYWHIPEAAKNRAVYELNPETDGEKTDRNSEMELMSPGSQFAFRVYYDEISESQLNKLMWALTLGENKEDADHCLKFGHGKPLGLGSAKVVIDSAWERTFSVENGEYKLEKRSVQDHVEAGREEITKHTGYKELLTLTSFSAKEGEAVCYPYVDIAEDVEVPADDKNAAASHHWFSENKKSTKPLLPGALCSEKLKNYTLTYYASNGQSGDQGNKIGSGGTGTQRADSHYSGYKQKHTPGEQHTGTVMGQVENKPFAAYVKLDNGQKVKLHISNVRNHKRVDQITDLLPVGTRVTLRYAQLQNGYVGWECLKY